MNSKACLKSVLVGIYNTSYVKACELLDELELLAKSCGIQTVDKILQKRDEPDSVFYMGKGKIEALRTIKEEKGFDLLIVDDDLKTSQVRNISKELGVRVIDRSELILDIFSKRASSKHAKLQVESARLKYEMSRLRRLWTHFTRTEGALGARGGMGETQLEIDRRRTRKRIADIESVLENVHNTRALQRKKRKDVFKVALVGYTNAGKSSLLNALAGTDIYVKDQLFATLDSTTRRVHMDKKNFFVLSDTVGFINKLPHHLIASFHATIGEIQDADLMLHVVDVSHPNYIEHVRVVEKTLNEINSPLKDHFLVFNKIDKIKEGWEERIRRVQRQFSHYQKMIPISALEGTGLSVLKDHIWRECQKEFLHQKFVVDTRDGKLLAYIEEHTQVLGRKRKGEKMIFEVTAPLDVLGRIQKDAFR